jgi:anti-anti-sigma factor
MSPIAMSRPPLRAPRRLVTETREQLRDAALRCLEELVREGATSLTIDLSDVTDVDIGGVGILVLLQKRARDRGITTRLAHTPVQVERLLALTQLDYLFEVEED